jgi:hypothetical protein
LALIGFMMTAARVNHLRRIGQTKAMNEIT